MTKRIAAIVLAVSFLSLAIAPETFAHRRGDCNRSAYTGYYGSYPTRLVAGRYYAAPYYSGVASRRYYAAPYYGSAVTTRYYGQRYYATPYYSGVASQRYYATPYYRSGVSSRYYGQRYYRRSSTGNLVLTVAAPAAIGAGVGAIAAGGKGAGIGALVGAGGGALYYLLKNRNRRY